MPKFFNILGFLRFILRRFDEDRCLQIASSLTYTTLLSLVPLVTITLTMISAFPVFSDLTTQLKIFILTNLVPDSAGKVITVYMQQFSENAARLTAMGVVFLGVTAFMLMLTIEGAFNSIWRVIRQRSLLNRFLIYWAVLTLGPLLIGASISLTSYLVSFSLGLVSHIPVIGIFLLKVIPVILTTAAFTLLYMTVPNRFVPLSHALIGGIFSGLAFELMKNYFTLYITHFGSYNLVYGAFASFPIFLLWIYFSWLVILLGAVIAASVSHWRGGAWQKKYLPGLQLYRALHILRVLYLAQRGGEAISLQRLQREVHLGFDDLEEILERLSAAGWVHRIAGNRWILSIDPDQVRVADVYRYFVFSPSQLVGDKQTELNEFLGKADASLEVSMNVSLKELFKRVVTERGSNDGAPGKQESAAE